MTTRCGCWCRSCNGAACSKGNMPARRCARTWAWRYRAPPTGTPRAGRPSAQHLQPQQRRVLLPAVNVAVVLGAGALRTRKAHLDRQRGVVVDDDDLGRVAVVEAGNGGAVDDLGVAGVRPVWSRRRRYISERWSLC